MVYCTCMYVAKSPWLFWKDANRKPALARTALAKTMIQNKSLVTDGESFVAELDAMETFAMHILRNPGKPKQQ